MAEFERNVAGIGTLADPVRRDLYQYVCAQAEPVGRHQAAAALGISGHQAKFHLDRLEAEGLLETGYARLTGRVGPGAGRTAKVYRRSERSIAVNLPEREYELAGLLMAGAIAESVDAGTPILTALSQAAAAHGEALGRDAVAAAGGSPHTPEQALGVVVSALARNGYEPRPSAGRVTMANCPFHSLAQTHTEMICQMNHALVRGLTDCIACGRVTAVLDPGADRCCVVIEGPAGNDGADDPAASSR